MHSLGIISPEKIESLGEGFVSDGLLEARRLSWNALQEISLQIKPGMTEREATVMADKLLRNAGSPRSWHRTRIRFGENTALPYLDKGNPDRALTLGEIFFIDIGPNWKLSSFGNIEYEGDVGHTLIAGKGNSEYAECIKLAKQLFDEATREWNRIKLTGTELYGWVMKRASELGYQIVPEDDGHRIGDFPHQRFSEKGLTEISFVPATYLWVLEIHLLHPSKRFGAFFEDILQN